MSRIGLKEVCSTGHFINMPAGYQTCQVQHSINKTMKTSTTSSNGTVLLNNIDIKEPGSTSTAALRSNIGVLT